MDSIYAVAAGRWRVGPVHAAFDNHATLETLVSFMPHAHAADDSGLYGGWIPKYIIDVFWDDESKTRVLIRSDCRVYTVKKGDWLHPRSWCAHRQGVHGLEEG